MWPIPAQADPLIVGRALTDLRRAMGIAVRSVESALDTAVHYQPAGRLYPTSGLQPKDISRS